MELHHAKHHNTYVNGLNTALQAVGEAEAKGDFTKAASQAPMINFHGGGHLNHSLFWENLAPSSRDGGGDPSGALQVCSLPFPFTPSPLPLPPFAQTPIRGGT